MVGPGESRTLAVVTGTRAEYGLLYWLMQGLRASSVFDLQVIVTGMHLSSEFGLTYREIEKDGFEISARVEMLLSSDSSVGIAKSTGLGLMGIAEALDRHAPDAVVLLGDRFETLAAAVAATFCRIPIIHLHGGEATEGVFDEAFRHSVTKMAHLHFTSTEAYRNRVVQLGEQPDRVFNVGAFGLDNIRNLNLLERGEVEDSLGIQMGRRNLLVTFHPVTLENQTAEGQFGQLLSVLNEFDEDTHVVFTLPNADSDGRVIIEMIRGFVAKASDRRHAFTSLGQLRYLSLMKHADAVVGNSSSGIIEAPSLQRPTVNIGDRQRGRIMAESVLCCEPTADAIRDAVWRALAPEMEARLKDLHNPYGEGGAAERTLRILEESDFGSLLKKKFHDLRPGAGTAEEP